MFSIYRYLNVLPLLVTVLFFTGCDSDEKASPPPPPIVDNSSTAANTEDITDTSGATPVTNIHGSNSADTSVILDDFQFAVLARPTKIMASKLVAPIMDALLSAAPDNQNPLSQLQAQTGIAVTQIERVLVLGSIPIPENNDESIIDEPQAITTETIDENQPAPDSVAEPMPDTADEQTPPTPKYGVVITLLEDANTDSLITKLKDSGFEATNEDGYEVWQNSFSDELAIHVKDSSTIMLGSKPELMQMVAGFGGDNALSQLVSSLSEDNLLVVATETKSVFDSVPEWAFNELYKETPQLAPVVAFMKKVSSSAIAINPDSNTPIFIELMTPDEESTIDVFTQVNFFASLGKSILPNQVRQFESNPNAEPEMIEALKMANILVQNISVTKTDNTITVSLETNDALRAQLIKFVKMGIANAKEKAVLEVPASSPQ
jgi:organic radical activating enzyme